jgi:hypothetical protein
MPASKNAAPWPDPPSPKGAAPRLGPEDEGPPPVRPDVQKAFWLRGDLAAAFSALLVERRRARPTTTERELLNEAVAKLVGP